MTPQDQYENAVSLIKSGQFRLAEELLRSLSRQFPDSSGVCFHLGIALFEQKQLAEALEMLTGAHNQQSHSLPILNYIERVLNALGRIEESIKLGEAIIRARYSKLFDRQIDLDNPKTFTEKIFSRMVIFHRRPIDKFQQCSNKVSVRDYVTKKVGSHHLSNLIWFGADPAEIPTDSLPPVFVLKANHGSGMVKKIMCPFEQRSIHDLSTVWLSRNYYWEQREFQYYGIKRNLMIEEFLSDQHSRGPLDYRFYCFDGKPMLVQVDDNSHSINAFYDLKWRKLDLSYRSNVQEFDIAKLSQFKKMSEIAAALSEDFSFVRVDLYNCNDRILFGELTFTPAAGNLKLKPPNRDLDIGSLWNFQPQYDRF